MTNAEIAAALEELAVLYQLDGADRYRVLAYVNSARTIRTEGSSVEEMAKNGTVTDLPGVGKTLEEKILALRKGIFSTLQERQRKIKSDTPAMSRERRVSGVGFITRSCGFARRAWTRQYAPHASTWVTS